MPWPQRSARPLSGLCPRRSPRGALALVCTTSGSLPLPLAGLSSGAPARVGGMPSKLVILNQSHGGIAMDHAPDHMGFTVAWV